MTQMTPHTTPHSWVALFPGQGSQHVGMAKDLYDQFPLVRALFEEASDAIHFSLKKLCFDGPESDLTLTENTQPALLTASTAAFRVFEQEIAPAHPGFQFQAAAGHSLGEYSALVATGALSFAQAVRFVRARGQAMQTAVPAGLGTMAAILGLEDDAVTALCARAAQETGETCEPANFNSPGQVVIAGTVDGVARATTLIKEDSAFAGGKAIALSVSAPFHCSLMRPARDQMARLFADAPAPQTPRFAYYPNRTARPTQEPTVIYELLIEQMDHPVLWRQSVVQMMERGITRGIEFGPGKVLAGLSKRIEKVTHKSLTVVGLSDTASLRALPSHF